MLMVSHAGTSTNSWVWRFVDWVFTFQSLVQCIQFLLTSERCISIDSHASGWYIILWNLIPLKLKLKVSSSINCRVHVPDLSFSLPGESSLPESLDSLLDALVHFRFRKTSQEDEPSPPRRMLSPDCDRGGLPLSLPQAPFRNRSCTDGLLHKGKFQKRALERSQRGAGFRERNLSIAMKGESYQGFQWDVYSFLWSEMVCECLWGNLLVAPIMFIRMGSKHIYPSTYTTDNILHQNAPEGGLGFLRFDALSGDGLTVSYKLMIYVGIYVTVLCYKIAAMNKNVVSCRRNYLI